MGASLCYKTNNGSLAFKKAGDDIGRLIYKSAYSNVYISWGDDGEDLDVCAFWEDFATGKVGYGWSNDGEKKTSGDGKLSLIWYGDDTGVSGSEKLLPNINPWGAEVSHRLFVYLNWYVSGTTCTIRATSSSGTEERILTNVRCGHREGQKADPEAGDPFVTITFDNAGNVISIVQ